MSYLGDDGRQYVLVVGRRPRLTRHQGGRFGAGLCTARRQRRALMLDIAAACLVVTALPVYLNHRFVH